jgi:1-aminocyclopropane-1-carboxylate deaminase/D-cysteine desulfhydrase-like pyridoxal-dependent ACC family enzyme
VSGNALEAVFPALAADLPYISLGEFPTPLDEAPGLAAELRIGSLAIKRDDLTSPIYGGNKVRKLEYLLADALARGCDTVVTYGSVGSNHALATAVYAVRLGLLPHAVLIDQAPSPDVARKLRYLLYLGARIHAARSFAHSREVFEHVRASHPGGIGRVCEIPWGGSNWLGATGFIAAALELARQVDAPPDFIYVSGGTLGTATGLALGLRVLGWPTRIVAPRAVPSGSGAAERLAATVAETNGELHRRDGSFPLFDAPAQNIDLRPEFYGPGYGESTPEAVEALELMRSLQGIKLEITYTAKAFAGLLTDARSGRLTGKRLIFWNTYNSAPYPEGIERVDTSTLPAEFRRYFQT